MKYKSRFAINAALCLFFSQASLALCQSFPVVEGLGSLIVAGNGHWRQFTYQDGEQPLISAYDGSGRLLPDGLYRYEYRSIKRLPAPESWTTKLSSPATAGRDISGSFRVTNGTIVFDR